MHLCAGIPANAPHMQAPLVFSLSQRVRPRTLANSLARPLAQAALASVLALCDAPLLFLAFPRLPLLAVCVLESRSFALCSQAARRRLASLRPALLLPTKTTATTPLLLPPGHPTTTNIGATPRQHLLLPTRTQLFPSSFSITHPKVITLNSGHSTTKIILLASSTSHKLKHTEQTHIVVHYYHHYY